MQLVIDLSPAQAERLRAEAERLGVKPGELAKAILADLLNRAPDDFTSTAERVVKKNAALYRRLT
jgi:hypothetical protein